MRIYSRSKQQKQGKVITFDIDLIKLLREEFTISDIKFEISEQIAVLSESPKGWTKELNLISWNGREPKYDIRDWGPNHEKMGKGVTLSKKELDNLLSALSKR